MLQGSFGKSAGAGFRSAQSGLLPAWMTEQQFQVASQMIEAFAGDRGGVLRFGENERALDDGLGIKRETSCAPIGADPEIAHRFGNVRFERGGVLAYALL